MGADQKVRSINIQIPSIPENIRIVESFIENAREDYNINDDIYGNIMVAVTEGINNAIMHGNKSDKNKNVSITLEQHDNALRFIILDEGPGFDFQSLPDPTSPENIDKPGGRGLYLIKHLCDELHFIHKGAGIELTFYID